MTERRVRAYIGLGANVGDATADAGRGGRALAALPRRPPPRRVAAVRDRAGRRHRPARFRNAVVALDVPAGADPASGALELLAALKELERDVRAPPPSPLGPARARPRPARLRPGAARGRAPARRALDRRRHGPGAGRPPPRSSRIPRPRPGSSCSRRWPTSRRASCRPAGADRRDGATAPQARLEGPDAVRPIGTWDGRRRGPGEPAQPR